MSLRLWLPLNEDLRNQGLDDVTVTNSGATIDNNGKIGKCYSFDGSNDYINITDFNMSNMSEFSISCWVKPSSDNINYLFLVRGNGQHQIRISGDGFCFRDNHHANQTVVSFDSNFEANKWTHILCVYKKGEIFLYQDGIQTAYKDYSHNDSQTNSNNTEIRIARQQSSSGNLYFNGLINDFRIYDEALSPKQIKELSKGLVLHYPLTRTQDLIFEDMVAIKDEDGNNLIEETSDDAILEEYSSDWEDSFLNIEYDVSGYGNNGTVTGSLTYSSDTPRYNTCTVFAGSQLIKATELFDEVKSVSLWFKTAKNKTTSQCIFGESVSGLCAFIFGGGIISYFRGSAGGTGSRVLFGDEYIENGWNHLVIIKTGDKTRDVWCNGIQLEPTTNNYYTHATGLFIGARNASGTLPFYGNVSDFRIYSTALSADDILALYHTPASIASNGVLMTQGEITEV